MGLVQPRTTTPTADALCREGFRTIAGREPNAQQIDRAVKVWFEEALADIWQFATHQDITRFRSLQNSATLVLTKGKRRYDWPEDFHRPICATLLQGTLTGTVSTDTADGDLTLKASNTGDLLGYDFTDFYVLSGKYLVMTSGAAEGAMREIVSAQDIAGPLHEFTIDSEWLTTELPAAGDTFFIAEERGLWVDEEMRDYMDNFVTRTGLGLPVAFNNFDKTLEVDVAPDAATYALFLRYWSNPLKINKESTVMQSILTDWRVPLTRYIEWKTARAIDDNRVAILKQEFDAAKLAIMEADYDYGAQFEGFSPTSSWPAYGRRW